MIISVKWIAEKVEQNILPDLSIVRVSTHEDILKLILDSPLPSQPSKTLQEQCTLQLVLTLESIWNLRNQAMHNGETINLIETISRLEHKVAEYMPILHHTKNLAQKEN